MKNTKYPRYQDYVIKDGAFVGEFEQMYRDFDDPWGQTQGGFPPDKHISLYWLHKYNISRVVELGCGLGQYTERIRQNGQEVLGVDISETAVSKAREAYPSCRFAVGDILDVHLVREFKAQAIIMSQITWYILDKIDLFLETLRSEKTPLFLIHELVTYPPGVQQYGTDKFTSLAEILSYFQPELLEHAVFGDADLQGEKRTVFIGRYGVSQSEG